MFGLGTIVNTIAVVAGGIIGLLFKNGLKNRVSRNDYARNWFSSFVCWYFRGDDRDVKDI